MERLTKDSAKLHFLGWDSPVLHEAVAWLNASAETPFWFHSTLCVLPGRRAARRFQELLTLSASKDDRACVLPTCISVGSLPEALTGSSQKYLSLAELEAVFLHLLTANPQFVTPLGKDEKDLLGLANELSKLWNLLGREGYTFSSAWTALKDSLVIPSGDARWETLSLFEDKLTGYLRDNALFEKSLQRAALLEDGIWASTIKQVILVGVTDIGSYLQRYLDQSPFRIHSLVPIPEEHREGVNHLGQLESGYWKTLHRSLGTPKLNVLSFVDQQSEAAEILRIVEEQVEKSGDPQDISISFPDESQLPYVEHAFSSSEVPIHSFAAISPKHRAFSRWCYQTSRLLQNGSYEELLLLLENEFSKILFFQEDNFLIRALLEEELGDKCLLKIFPLSDWRLPVLSENAKRWLAAVDSFLHEVQGERGFFSFVEFLAERAQRSDFIESGLSEVVLDSLQQVTDQLSQVETIPGAVDTATEFFSLMSQAALEAGRGQGDLNRGREEPGVELLGWLETLHDDAPTLLVAGFHDEAIPASKREDVWLPGATRNALGIESAERVLARDYFFLLHATHSRRHLQVFYPQRNVSGDFYRPSRLLFGGQKEEVFQIANALFRASPKELRIKRFGRDFGRGEGWKIQNPIAEIINGPEVVSVTSFRDYIRCPFRFYLRHVLKLEVKSPPQEELDARLFGVLFHEVVSRFGVSQLKDSSDAPLIEDFLTRELSRLCGVTLGNTFKPTVEVQILQLEERLKQFALLQSEWREAGWKIVATEIPFPNRGVPLATEVGPVYLSGRIDRVDYNEERNSLVALDYKTGAKFRTPEEMHLVDGEWIDLQLPLYRYALPFLDLTNGKDGSDIQTGYISLPSATEEGRISLASWTAAESKDAEKYAAVIAEKIRIGSFWPPTRDPLTYDEFSDLLGTGQYQELFEFFSQAEQGGGLE